MADAGNNENKILPLILQVDTKVWWKNRRIHSYLSIFGLFCIMLISYHGDPAQINAAAPILQTLAWIFGTIIFLFVGAATTEDITKLLSLRNSK